MAVFESICGFCKVNKMPIEFHPYNGLFISPLSLKNMELSEKFDVVFLKGVTVLDVYNQKYPHVIEAVKHFLERNSVEFNPLDNKTFSTYLAILCYCMAFFKRNMKGEDIKSLKHKFAHLEKYLTIHNIDEMYSALMHHLMYDKGLSEQTTKDILFGCDVGHRGIENVLALLNAIEEIYHKVTPNARQLLAKRLRYNIDDFVSKNPMSERIGNELEAFVYAQMDDVKDMLRVRFGAQRAIILDFDIDKKIKRKMKKTKNIRVPDFFYFDNLGNLVAVDSKFSLFYAKTDQVSASNTQKIIEFLNLKEEIEKLAA